jgi:hypothetical protein
VFDVEGDHFPEAEAENGNGFGRLGWQGIEIEDEDPDRGVGQDEGDGAAFGRELAENGANSGDYGIVIADVWLGDTGDKGRGGEWRE